MKLKEMVRKIGQRYIDKINDMRVVAVDEVNTVKELRDCLEAFILKDGSNSYLMGEEQNGFLVELVKHRLSDGSFALDIRLTENKGSK